jgi:CheY-like chemotaxis protein
MPQHVMTFLIVDESSVDQWLLSEALSEEVPQAEILRISTGTEAFAVLRALEARDPADVIIMDYQTPPVLRQSLLDMLEHEVRWQARPVVVVHDQRDGTVLDAWTRSTLLTVLSKPVSFEEYLHFAAKLGHGCLHAHHASVK